jgi:hypothetical protein
MPVSRPFRKSILAHILRYWFRNRFIFLLVAKGQAAPHCLFKFTLLVFKIASLAVPICHRCQYGGGKTYKRQIRASLPAEPEVPNQWKAPGH